MANKPKNSQNNLGNNEIPNPANYGNLAKMPANMQDIEKQIPPEVKKEIEKTREQLQNFKKQLVKKFSYIDSIGILPPWASQIAEEEEEVIKEKKDEKLIHVVIILPDEKIKELPKVKAEAVNLVKNFKPRVWLHIKTRAMIWETSFDGKYQLIDGFALSFPLHDKDGFLAALRLTTIHKRMCLAKFERYVVSYVLVGSLVRGQAKKSSDVDVFIVIDDTDVKRMSRYELKEKLRSIIWSYGIQAGEEAGVKNKLNVQIYILTDFWESVKDAHPVIFTMIRDGVPLYDRGAFMPWKLLLRMGKIKPSPEAIDLFMSMGDKMKTNIKRRLLDIVMEDIFWGVCTPSQAVLMLYGLPPPTVQETVKEMRRVFYEKERLLEKKYIDILENIMIKYYKGYEHGKIKEIKGVEIDKLLKDADDYMKRLKELMRQIEERAADTQLTEQYKQIKELVEHLVGKTSESTILEKFKKELISKKKVAPRNLILLEDILDIIKKNKKKPKKTKTKVKAKKKEEKISKHDLARMRRYTHELCTDLLEYIQKRDLQEIQKNKADIIYTVEKDGKKIKKQGDLFIFDNIAFIIPDTHSDEIKKIEKGKISEAKQEELKTFMKKKATKKVTPELIQSLQKYFKDIEIIF